MKVKYRIKSNIEFRNIVKKGDTLKSKEFTIHYLKNQINHSRVGISVSSKLGCAVIRNKIKRQVREIVRKIKNLDEGKLDIVIIVRSNYLNNNFINNLNALKQLFNKLEENNEKEK